MTPATRDWLAALEDLAGQARRAVVAGEERALVIKRLAHVALEPTGFHDCEQLCRDLHIAFRGNSFAAEGELFDFACKVIGELVP